MMMVHDIDVYYVLLSHAVTDIDVDADGFEPRFGVDAMPATPRHLRHGFRADMIRRRRLSFFRSPHC